MLPLKTAEIGTLVLDDSFKVSATTCHDRLSHKLQKYEQSTVSTAVLPLRDSCIAAWSIHVSWSDLFKEARYYIIGTSLDFSSSSSSAGDFTGNGNKLFDVAIDVLSYQSSGIHLRHGGSS